MIDLHIEWDYLVGDTDEWIEDRTAGLNEDAQRNLDEVLSSWEDTIPHRRVWDSEVIEKWLASIGATGLYGEGPATMTMTYNEDNFLSRDLAFFLAHTEEYGDLFIWSYADVYGPIGVWHAYTFNGDDDADAYSYGSGWAVCSCQIHTRKNDQDRWPYGGCDAEWILEAGGCYLWNNGGGGGMYDDGKVNVSDILHRSDEDGIESYAICPRCHYGNLTFFGG